jgi:hypothetical protein
MVYLEITNTISSDNHEFLFDFKEDSNEETDKKEQSVSRLEFLSLKRVGMNNEDLRKIIAMVEGATLRGLDFEDNIIDDESIDHLIEYLIKRETPLPFLNLSKNKLSNKGVRDLIVVDRVQELTLSENLIGS